MLETAGAQGRNVVQEMGQEAQGKGSSEMGEGETLTG